MGLEMNKIKTIFAISSLLVLVGCGHEDNSKALGTIERDRITYAATSSEIIRDLPVKEGSFVEKGVVIVRLDTKRQETEIKRAEAEVAAKRAYLTKLINGSRKEDISAAKAHVDRALANKNEAEKNYRRIVELVEKKLAPYSDLDKAKATRLESIAAYTYAAEELSKKTTGTRQEDLDKAKAELEAAIATKELEIQKFEDLIIMSTRSGILESLPFNEGERVKTGAYVAVMQASDKPFARVYLPEKQRLKYKMGEKVKVSVDGSEKLYEGVIRWIATDPSFTPYYALTEDERSRLMYLTEVTLTTPDSNEIPSGLPAQMLLEN